MSLEKRIEKIIDSMPSLPITVAKIMEITKNPASSPSDLNKVITVDPVLTGKVLKLINSAYYNLENQVTSIVKAIIMLGLNTIKNLAISTAILGTITKKENFVALNMDGYWRHSLAVGVTAKLIASKINVDLKLRDEYFIAGLLHDIGKIVMNQQFSDLYLQTIHQADIKGTQLWVEENEKMGITHSKVGELIAKKWQLSPPLTEAITYHHLPLEASKDTKRIVYAVTIANYFCVQNDIGFSGSRIADTVAPEVWEFLSIKEEDLFDMEEQIEHEIEKASVFLQIQERK